MRSQTVWTPDAVEMSQQQDVEEGLEGSWGIHCLSVIYVSFYKLCRLRIMSDTPQWEAFLHSTEHMYCAAAHMKLTLIRRQYRLDWGKPPALSFLAAVCSLVIILLPGIDFWIAGRALLLWTERFRQYKSYYYTDKVK